MRNFTNSDSSPAQLSISWVLLIGATFRWVAHCLCIWTFSPLWVERSCPTPPLLLGLWIIPITKDAALPCGGHASLALAVEDSGCRRLRDVSRQTVQPSLSRSVLWRPQCLQSEELQGATPSSGGVLLLLFSHAGQQLWEGKRSGRPHVHACVSVWYWSVCLERWDLEKIYCDLCEAFEVVFSDVVHLHCQDLRCHLWFFAPMWVSPCYSSFTL